MKNRARKSKSWKNLYKENWRLCHEIVERRDGKRCQIQGCKNNSLQLDHVFSRQIKALFFEPDNLGFLCSRCHTHKSFRKGQWVDMMVRQICQERIGKDRWDWMMFAAKKLCPEFPTIYHQENANRYLRKRFLDLK